MKKTPAQKAVETRRRRQLERQHLSITDPEDLVDLALPVRASKGQIRRSLAGLARLLREAVKEKPDIPDENHFLSDAESIVVLLSDLHFGKLIKNSYDKSRVDFNIDIGRQRMNKILNETLRLSSERDVDEIVVLLAGDLIDGEGIYATQATHLEQIVIEQVKGTAKGLFNFMRSLHQVSKLPVRAICCPGNHGRISKTADEMSNWDQAIHIILTLMSDLVEDDIVIEYPETRQFIVSEIKGRRLLLRHKAKRGTSPSPTSQWYNWMLQHEWDVAAAGHWHTPAIEFIFNRPIFRNGSLCGTDDFGESLGYGDAACQWIWGMSVDSSMTFAHLVTFDDEIEYDDWEEGY